MPPKTNNFTGLTDVGRMRGNNEDAFIAEAVMDHRYIAACAIDGVGGYEGGEVAARLARESILDYLRIPSGEIGAMLREALSAANDRIHAEKKRNPQWEGMACVVTLALADLKNNRFSYAHVGDTRLYLFRDQTLVKITRDQSFVGFLEDSGRLTEEAAMTHPKRNEINKALGFDARIGAQPDYIESGESPFLPGDLLLLCSDGLTDLVPAAAITSILQRPLTLPEKAQALVNAANNEGGKDNITVVLVQNDSRPVKQVATKPTVQKQSVPRGNTVPRKTEAVPVVPEVRPEPPVPHRKSWGRTAAILLLLCLVFLSGLAWMLYDKYQTQTRVVVPPPAPVLGHQEKRLAEAVSQAGDTLVLDDSFGDTIVLSSSILLGRDTLYIRGRGKRLLADSTLQAPGLIFSANCRRVVVDSLTFDGFGVAMAVQNKAVRLRRVRFTNCRVPIQSSFAAPADYYISGLAGDTTFRIDSLPKPRNRE